MTLVAGLREVRGDVVRIGGALIVLEMATHAGFDGDVVVVVDVAVGALARRNGVLPSQRKAGGRVIELAIGPLHGVVALLARGWEASMGHGAGGLVVIVLVATDASGDGDAVIVVGVAIRALPRRYAVGTGERESGFRVIKLRGLPCRGVVASLTGLGESAGDVIWVRCVLKILQVAGHASHGGQVVIVVDVTVGTLPRRHGVSAG